MINLDSLNPPQREAVTTLRGPVLILAGAGTGKTRVITTRLAHMIERGVSPQHVLAVTFTNKAAREMLERVRALLPRPARPTDGASAPRPTICTFHALGVRILRENIERLGYKRHFVIYDESEQLATIKRILSRISMRGESVDPQAVLNMLSRFKNVGDQEPAFGDPNIRALAEHVRNHYDSALRACNAVDFDDLLLLTLRLFAEHPDVLEACRARYRYVMVDEYQDTNAAQFQIVHALTREHRNLCVVGDDDQSIYGWRGAQIANLLDLERHFPEVKVIKLERNYRSTATILDAANALIRHNARRRSKRLWSDKGQGSPITLFAFKDEEDEARSVVEELEFARQARRIPWGDHAILFRTNQQARPIETALRKAGVRYHVVGGQSFFDRREVRDMLAYLKVFLNPHDDISLLRIANVPARGLSDITMQRLLAASQERRSSVFAAMQDTGVLAAFQAKTRASVERFVGFVQTARGQLEAASNHNPRALREWAEQFLDAAGYFAELRRSEKDPEAGENRVRNLMEFVAAMDAQCAPGLAVTDRLEQFLEEITLDTEREKEDDTPGDAVTLITIHSCKGLEFPHVMIVGLEEGLLPHARSKEEGTLDEERRLFYVAITRAMRTLKLSHCAARRRYGELAPCHPSQFLRELPEELIEHAADQASVPVTPEAGSAWFAAMRDCLETGTRGSRPSDTAP